MQTPRAWIPFMGARVKLWGCTRPSVSHTYQYAQLRGPCTLCDLMVTVSAEKGTAPVLWATATLLAHRVRPSAFCSPVTACCPQDEV